jgi:hypothetical protein
MELLKRIGRRLTRPARRLIAARRGYQFGTSVRFADPGTVGERPKGALEEYFDAHLEGPGIWKWRHYFDVYEHHVSRFVGTDVHVLEIGVYSGGSLGMWQHYFGPGCRIHGIDIAAECRVYERDGIEISIGDQADPSFWASVLKNSPPIDIVIDDGGHLPHQQIATLEALLPRIRPGGVYVCEDSHGAGNEFHAYVSGLARSLYTWAPDLAAARAQPSELQRMVKAIHLYPFMVVIERSEQPLGELVAPRHGTEWQPFLWAPPEPAEAESGGR